MSTCEREATIEFEALDLPPALEDVEGLVAADLRAIVAMLATQANERLFLTRRELRQLQQTLWNRLVGSLNEAVAPLTVDSR
jgi:Mrp family chromosome partitioning ATPase